MVRSEIVHLSTAHSERDNRIYRKECVALQEAGMSVTYVVAGAPGSQNTSTHYYLPRRAGRLGRMLRGPIDAWIALRNVQPKVLHVHDPELIPLAILWSRKNGRAAIYDAHEDLPKQVMGKPYLPSWSRRIVAASARRLESSADRHLHGIVAATPSIARNFRNERTVLVQNFPWLREYVEPTVAREANRNTACYVGSVSHERGWRQMVDAVLSTSSTFTLTVAGPLTSAVVADLEHVPDDRVKYLGNLSADDVPALIADSAVGIVVLQPLPNYLESQPTKLFEYMASARPFVASDFPAWREMFGRYDCGIFVDPASPAAIAAALDRLAGDGTLAASLGANGRRALIENFTFEQQAAGLVRMSRELLSWCAPQSQPG